MLSNFHLAAIVKAGQRPQVLRIPLTQALQNRLTHDWNGQYEAFVDGIEEIDFDAGYKPEKHERFRISDYEPPDWLKSTNSLNVVDQDNIARNDSMINAIQGVVGVARDEQDHELMLFQNFTRSRVIRPGRALFVDGGTYNTVQRPGLTLDGALTAVYRREDRKLLFSSFRAVNTFLPLADHYKEASEQEIREILGHQKLKAEDADASVAGVDQWFRTRFAMLKDSGVLDQYSPDEIVSRSVEHNVSIQVSQGRIVFPAAKREAKRILQFLNEELYKGPITQTLYETNSKREAAT